MNQRTVFATWWPLAASWLLMSLELPSVAAVMARLPDPELNLAAYGGIVFPISLLIEAPIIMMLAASTAVSKNWESFARLRQFMLVLSAALTVVHALVAFTPLYDVIIIGILKAPAELHELGRTGLMIMTPWTFAIAVRRFLQGVLIRFGHSRLVGVGTSVRLVTILAALAIGVSSGGAGVVVGTSAVVAGVTAEMLFILFRARPVLYGPLRDAVAEEAPMSLRQLSAFYVPLAFTPVLNLFAQPVVSAALSRMPNPIESLAVLPVLNAVAFGMRSLGIAFNEVVVALMDEPGGREQLATFARRLAIGATVLIMLFVATPISRWWFGTVSGLNAGLVALAVSAAWIYIPSPSLSVVQNWNQGILVGTRNTRAITESVGIYLVVTVSILAIGVYRLDVAGIYVSATAVTAANVCLALWLMKRRSQI